MRVYSSFTSKLMVDRFDLIATTGKNAKMPPIIVIQSSKLSAF